MEDRNDRIRLAGAETLFTDDPREAYAVEKGTAYVRIAKTDGEGHAKDNMVFLLEAGKDTVIPAFSWEGTDHEKWRFVILAKEGEVILSHDARWNTRYLRKHFLMDLAGAEEKDIDAEGFEGALAQMYKLRKTQDAGVIREGSKQERETGRKQKEAIGGALSGGDEPLAADGTDLFRTVSYACAKLGIRMASWDHVQALCEGKITVPELARACGFLSRPVVLEPDWDQYDCGVILSSADGKPVACIPTAGGKYTIYHSGDTKAQKLTRAEAMRVDPKAYVLGRALPPGKLTRKDLIGFVRKSVYTRDVARAALLGLACTCIGILLPILNQKIYDDYIPMSDESSVLQISLVIAAMMLGNVFFTLVKSLYQFRITSRSGYQLQDAVYHRIFQLEESFLRKFDSADMAERLSQFGQIASSLLSKILGSGLSAVWSIIFLIQMIHYSGKLTVPAVIMIPVYCLLVFFISSACVKYKARIAQLDGTSVGRLYQYLEGVGKIRMAGAEQRAILQYTVPAAEAQQAAIRSNRISDFCDVLRDSAPTIFSMIFYFVVVYQKMDTTSGNFMAFNTAFGSFAGAMISLMQEYLSYREMKPQMERLRPILEAETENAEGRDAMETIQGDVELRNVTFSYSADSKPVLRDVSFHIRPGEYVGIVGPSGCGKSTIMKLLLGFEKPGSGQVCYDGKDVNSMDKRSLRKKLGAALQNGRLIAGSIYENITITSANPSMKRVDEVIDAVGLRSDIDAMPMGIHTMVSESGGTLSGGQQQRILIARAIYSNPAVLLFDEATSALDNVTQAKVCESLDAMRVTRLVIAHRLSTIQNCDRILVMEEGKIVDEGTYDTLMAHEGLFRQMAIRQIAEADSGTEQEG